LSKVLDRRAFLVAAGIARLQLHLFGGLLAEIGDGEPTAENLVAADLELGLVVVRQIVSNGL